MSKKKLFREQLVAIGNIINKELDKKYKKLGNKVTGIIEFVEDEKNHIAFNLFDITITQYRGIDKINYKFVCDIPEIKIKECEPFSKFSFLLNINIKKTVMYDDIINSVTTTSSLKLHIGGFIGEDGSDVELFESNFTRDKKV